MCHTWNFHRLGIWLAIFCAVSVTSSGAWGHPVSSCINSLCQHGSTCYPSEHAVLGYMCHCQSGFHGDLCEFSNQMMGFPIIQDSNIWIIVALMLIVIAQVIGLVVVTLKWTKLKKKIAKLREELNKVEVKVKKDSDKQQGLETKEKHQMLGDKEEVRKKQPPKRPPPPSSEVPSTPTSLPVDSPRSLPSNEDIVGGIMPSEINRQTDEMHPEDGGAAKKKKTWKQSSNIQPQSSAVSSPTTTPTINRPFLADYTEPKEGYGHTTEQLEQLDQCKKCKKKKCKMKTLAGLTLLSKHGSSDESPSHTTLSQLSSLHEESSSDQGSGDMYGCDKDQFPTQRSTSSEYSSGSDAGKSRAIPLTNGLLKDAQAMKSYDSLREEVRGFSENISEENVSGKPNSIRLTPHPSKMTSQPPVGLQVPKPLGSQIHKEGHDSQHSASYLEMTNQLSKVPSYASLSNQVDAKKKFFDTLTGDSPQVKHSIKKWQEHHAKKLDGSKLNDPVSPSMPTAFTKQPVPNAQEGLMPPLPLPPPPKGTPFTKIRDALNVSHTQGPLIGNVLQEIEARRKSYSNTDGTERKFSVDSRREEKLRNKGFQAQEKSPIVQRLGKMREAMTSDASFHGESMYGSLVRRVPRVSIDERQNSNASTNWMDE